MRRKSPRNQITRLANQSRKKSLPFVIALANKVLNAIGFVDFINDSVEWDEKQCRVSPGHLAKATVLSTFFDVRAPLSKVADTFEDIDTEFLFGTGVSADHLNDCAIGRSLDKIADAAPDTLFSTLALSAYSVYNVAFKRLHSDTTSVSFYGDYKQCMEPVEPQQQNLELREQAVDTQHDGTLSEEITDDHPITDEEILRIVHGYNKDNRPECKQVVVGKIVNEHGIPLASSVMNGNTSDVEWNEKALQLLNELYGKELDERIYIADSKLINQGLFRSLMRKDKTVQFISRCPANFDSKLAERVTEKAYAKAEWVDLEPFSDRKKASQYRGQEFLEQVYGKTVRCLVYQTSEGTQRFEQKKEKALETLKKEIRETERKTFACKADAEKELQRFEKAHRKAVYRCGLNIETTQVEKRPRGNPGKNPKPPVVVTTWSLRGSPEENRDAMDALQRKEESFVLITNVFKSDRSVWEILDYYKDQSVVEIQFRLLKEPCIASVIFLKTPQRIRALIMLLGIALLVRALVQYKLRQGLQNNTEELPKIGWNGAQLQPNPTMFFLKSAMVNHAFVRERAHEYTYSFTTEFNELRITTLLQLMGLRVEDLIG